MGTVDHRGNLALRKIGNPADFKWFAFECMGDTNGTVKLTGCVPGVYVRGPKKGKPKYDGARIIELVTDAEFIAERASYEGRTGNCEVCGGDGQQWVGWHRKTGNEWKTCIRCSGSGKPPSVGAVDPVAGIVTG